MIPIIGDFNQFSAKILAIFLNNKAIIFVCLNLSQNRQFGGKIFQKTHVKECLMVLCALTVPK
jgi:hypothetical protein